LQDKDRAIETIDRIRNRYGLKMHETTALAVLVFAAGDKMECSLTVGEISDICGRSRSSVRRGIRSLEQKGILTREAQYYEDEDNARAANKYTILAAGERHD
jgi:predicted transcriptional regulator